MAEIARRSSVGRSPNFSKKSDDFLYYDTHKRAKTDCSLPAQVQKKIRTPPKVQKEVDDHDADAQKDNEDDARESNAEELYVGAQFSTFSGLMAAIESYSAKYNVKLNKFDARRLSTASKSRWQSNRVKDAPAELVYKSIYYLCAFRDRLDKSKDKGMDKKTEPTLRQCPFVLNVNLTKDSKHLEVTKMSSMDEHNHPVLNEIKKEPDILAESQTTKEADCDLPVTSAKLSRKLALKLTRCAIPGQRTSDIKRRKEKAVAVSDRKKSDSRVIGEIRSDSQCDLAETDIPLDGSGDIVNSGEEEPGISSSHVKQDEADNTTRSHTSNVFNTMLSFQRHNLFCDTVMRTRDGVKIYAHGVVLAAACPNLQGSINQNPFEDRQPNVIDFIDYDSSVIHELAEFFYTGQYDKSSDHAAQIEELLEILGASQQKIDVLVDNKKSVDEDNDIHLAELDADEQDDLLQAVDRSSEDVVLRNEWLSASSHQALTSLEVRDIVQKTATESDLPEDVGAVASKKKPSVKRDSADDSNSPKTEIAGGGTKKPTGKRGRPSKSSLAIKTAKREPGSYSCPFCDQVFTTKLMMNRHKWDHSELPDGSFQCKRCMKIFSNRQKLRAHDLQRHLNPDSKRYFQCPICGHEFNHRLRFESHMNVHSGARPHMCDICGLRVNDGEFMRKHYRLHAGDYRHVCAICDKRFFTRHQLTKHMRSHTGERPYQCTTCGSRFTQTSALKLHQLTHSGLRAFTCEICSKTFQRPAHLRQHVISIHVPNDMKPFICQECGHGFPSAFYLGQHMKFNCGNKRRKRRKQREPCYDEVVTEEIENAVDIIL